MQGDHSVILEVRGAHLGIWLKLVNALLDRYPGASLMPFNEREMHLYIHGRDSIDGTFFDGLVEERILAMWYYGSDALVVISEQVLDLFRSAQIQQEITEKYQWK